MKHRYTFRIGALGLLAALSAVAIATNRITSTYALVDSSVSEAGFAMLLPASANAKMSRYVARFSGTVQVQATAQAGRLLVTFTPRRLDLTLDDRPMSDAAGAVREAMSHPILVSVRDTFRVMACRFDGSVSPDAERYERYLLSRVQFSVPSSQISRNGGPKKRAVWQAHEADPTGELEAKYVVLESNPASYRVRRTLGAYRRTAAQKLTDRHLTSTGSIDIKVSPTRGILSLAGHLRERGDVGGKTASSSESRIELHLIEAASKAVDSNVVASLLARPAVGLYTPPDPHAEETAIQQAALGTDTEVTVLASFDDAIRSNASEDTVNAVYLKLHALAYLHPEAALTMGDRLLKASPAGAEFQQLARALVSAATVPAQHQLVRVIKARASEWEVIARLLPAFVTIQEPTTELRTCVIDLGEAGPTSDVRTMATMIGGALARQLSAANPIAADGIVKALLHRLQSAADSGQKRILLLALGNSAAAVAFPVVHKYVESPRPELRSAACTALRWMPDKTVARILTGRLSEDKDASVRFAAAGALRFLPATTAIVEALCRVATHDTDAQVRQASLASAWPAHKGFATVVTSAKTMAAKDASEENRKLAKKLLADG